MKHETSTRNKIPTSQASKAFLKEHTSLKLEYELYEFVRNTLKQLQRTFL